VRYFDLSLFHVHTPQAELTKLLPSTRPQKLLRLHSNQSSILTNDASCAVKVSTGLSWQKQHLTRRPFSPANGLQFMEQTSKVLHL
jgi:hypothetical protein